MQEADPQLCAAAVAIQVANSKSPKAALELAQLLSMKQNQQGLRNQLGWRVVAENDPLRT